MACFLGGHDTFLDSYFVLKKYYVQDMFVMFYEEEFYTYVHLRSTSGEATLVRYSAVRTHTAPDSAIDSVVPAADTIMAENEYTHAYI